MKEKDIDFNYKEFLLFRKFNNSIEKACRHVDVHNGLDDDTIKKNKENLQKDFDKQIKRDEGVIIYETFK